MTGWRKDIPLKEVTRLGSAHFARRAVLALLASTWLLSAATSAQPPTSLINKRSPEFIRTSLTGQKVRLADYSGKVVLLNFWATWCAPCLHEMPHFVDWQSRWNAKGFQIIGVSMDDDSGPVRPALKKLGVNYPVVMGDEKLGALYGGVLGLPVTFLIDRSGVIRARFDGEADLTKIEGQIQTLLAKSR